MAEMSYIYSGMYVLALNSILTITGERQVHATKPHYISIIQRVCQLISVSMQNALGSL